jgi:hypothetical protein
MEELKKDMKTYEKKCQDQRDKSLKIERLIFTAGEEGSIKAWNLPK